MKRSDDPTRRELRALRAYVLAMTGLLTVLSLAAFRRAGEKPSFEEIDVERINIVEKDGRVRLVIANRARSPGPIAHGKPFGSGGTRPGLIFYNDEGTESGGLIFSGKRENGKVSAGAGLTFDQYDQDQVVALQYLDENGRRHKGLAIWDRPEVPVSEVVARRRTIDSMPEGAGKTAALEQWLAYQGGIEYSAPRLFAGRTRSKAAMVQLYDPSGKPRLRLQVDSLGAARIEFLDDRGRVTDHLPDNRRGDPPRTP